MIIFDLDGTLALDAHRSHHLRGEKKDWDAYFSACGEDELSAEISRILVQFTTYTDIPEPCVLWSGRAGEYLRQTEDWLRRHEIFDLFNEIRLRPIGNREEDTEMKRRWLHEARAKGQRPWLVFEDRQRVVDMWRAEGLVCCQVAPGDF